MASQFLKSPGEVKGITNKLCLIYRVGNWDSGKSKDCPRRQELWLGSLFIMWRANVNLRDINYTCSSYISWNSTPHPS